MRVNWHIPDLELPDRLRKEIDRKVSKLGTRLSDFAEDMVDLKISLEQVGSKNQYRCILNLHLPQRTIHAEEIREEQRRAINAAFDDLFRQSKRFMARLRREEDWQRDRSTAMATEETEEG
jgi:ribosomal subunit interface protein